MDYPWLPWHAAALNRLQPLHPHEPLMGMLPDSGKCPVCPSVFINDVTGAVDKWCHHEIIGSVLPLALPQA